MSTLNDVAQKAGVSKTLVSRVINNQKGVSPQNRKKIREAIKELDYQPNALARSLVKRCTQTIGIVMDTICDSFFFPLVDGLEAASSETDYNLVFSSAQNRQDLKQRAAEYYMQGRADGMILYGSRLSDKDLIYSLAETNFPFVVVENTFPELDINNVYLDNEYGAKLAVEHLISCGCRRIYHVSGNRHFHVTKDRENGYLKTMQDHGFPESSRGIIPGDFTEENTYQMMVRFIRETPRDQMPDGLFCSSDKTAYGVIRALQDNGFSVPQDVKIVGFDDEPPSDPSLYPALTTLSQPLFEMGKASFDLVLEKISDSDVNCQKVVFYPQLIIRNTTASAAGTGG